MEIRLRLKLLISTLFLFMMLYKFTTYLPSARLSLGTLFLERQVFLTKPNKYLHSIKTTHPPKEKNRHMSQTFPCPQCRRQLTLLRQDYVQENEHTYTYITQYGCQKCNTKYYQTTPLTADQPKTFKQSE